MTTKKILYIGTAISLAINFISGATAYGESGASFGTRYHISNLHQVTLRSEPGLEEQKIYSLPQGEEGTIIGGPNIVNNMTWWKVAYADNKSGWVHERLIDIPGYKARNIALDDFSYLTKVKNTYFLASADGEESNTKYKTDFREPKLVQDFPTYVPKTQSYSGGTLLSNIITVFYETGFRIKHISFGIPYKYEPIEEDTIFVIEDPEASEEETEASEEETDLFEELFE